MSTIDLEYEAASGGGYAIRVIGLTGGEAGQVLDFNDSTMKAIGSATTPYKAATERTGVCGSGRSSYTVNLDLAAVNSKAYSRFYRIKWYTGSAPATTVNPVKDEDVMLIRNGNAGWREWIAQCELSVKSTAGSTAQVSVWLEDGGEKVAVGTLDGATTASLVVREHASGANLFTKSLVAGDLHNHIFEAEQASPGFTDDRQYLLTASVVVNGVTFSTTHCRPVIG